MAGAVLFCFFLTGVAFSQERVSFVISGKSHSDVPALHTNGMTYVDIQKTARKLGTGVELYAHSKQAKISARGFYAIFTANQ